MIVPPEREEEAKTRFNEHAYNVVANELLPANRTLADNRYEE